MSVIEKTHELEAYFHDAGKPREKWRVGTEYEKVGIYRDTGQAIPYFGKRGVDFILRELMEVAEPLGIVFLGLGMQPVSRLEQIEWVPKQRYRIMAPYMLKVGKLGQRMMKQTATVQANIDYSDEKDAMAKFRTGMGLA